MRAVPRRAARSPRRPTRAVPRPLLARTAPSPSLLLILGSGGDAASCSGMEEEAIRNRLQIAVPHARAVRCAKYGGGGEA